MSPMAKDTLCIIPVFGPDAKRATWSFMGETLLERTLKIVQSVPMATKTVILTDSAEHLRDLGIKDRVVKTAGLSAFLETEKELDGWSAMAVIDPLRPFFQSNDLASALSKFYEQKNEKRLPVVSVSSVPNQYHPRKVLNINTDGSLRHYDSSGNRVYRRQQLDGDVYYVLNDALCVMSPDTIRNHGRFAGKLAAVIEKAAFRVQSKADLNFALKLVTPHD